MLFVRVFRQSVLDDVVFFIQIGLRIAAPVDLGDGRGLLLALYFFRLNFQRLKQRITGMLLKELLTDFQSSGEVAIDKLLPSAYALRAASRSERTWL